MKYVLEGVIIFEKIFEKLNKFFYKKENDRNTYTQNKVKITNISDIETSQVNPDSRTDNFSKSSVNWCDKLTIPYERKVMEVSQVKKETLKFFDYLCNFIDDILKKDGTSLEKLIIRLQNENKYYNNILYTIYCISEGHVIFFYSGTKKYYDPEFSYQILEENLGISYKNLIYNKAKELEKYISSPDNKTKKYFKIPEMDKFVQGSDLMEDKLNLSSSSLQPKKSNNFKYLWWDEIGVMREERKFTRRELRLLSIYSLRNTKIWNYHDIRKQMVLLYLHIWTVIIKKLNDKKITWKAKNMEFLQEIVETGISPLSYEIWQDEKYIFMSSLCKIVEHTIRLKIPSQSKIDISIEQEIVESKIPVSVYESINQELSSYIIPDDEFLKILDVLLNENPSNQNIQLNRFKLSNLDDKLEMIVACQNNKNYTDFLKKILKLEEKNDIFLLCLFEINKREKLSPANQKFLNTIIHESNKKSYLSLLESDNESLVEIFNELVLLKEIKRKRINLDINKIENSKKDLKNTIDIVEEYINVEEDIENILDNNIIDETEIIKEDDFMHKNFVISLIGEGLPINKVEEIASHKGLFFNAFINEVNKELYGFVDDEAIIIEDDFVKIDDFYFDIIKELVIND